MIFAFCLGFPPHVRGWTGRMIGMSLRSTVSPARAGMDRAHTVAWLGADSFPRTCGDGPAGPSVRRAAMGFPPHVRGWTDRSTCAERYSRVSPARAGMDLSEDQ